MSAPFTRYRFPFLLVTLSVLLAPRTALQGWPGRRCAFDGSGPQSAHKITPSFLIENTR